MHELRPLHEGWTVRAVAGAGVDQVPDPVPAAVPGCVHTDLLAAGLIDDPYLDDNETRLAWIGRTDWCFETEFDLPGDDPLAAAGAGAPAADGLGSGAGGSVVGGLGSGAGAPAADRVELLAAGLDTVATVRLNGAELGRTANMHRGYRFDVRELLRPTGNRLTVTFESAYAYAERVRELVGERPNAYPEPFQYIRKMACNFGWDWGPTLVTAGIWQQIGLARWSVARLAEVRPLVTVDGDVGRVEVHVTVERAGDAPLWVAATVDGVRSVAEIAPNSTRAVLTVAVPRVRRWWPRGFGQPHRYDLDVRLGVPGAPGEPPARPAGASGGGELGDGPVLDAWRRRIGFRRVEVDTTADADGTRFVLRVNGVPVFVRGVNWIPDDAFVTRVDRARYAQRLDQACAAGVNYLRVWGGGRYESDDFYDLADGLGLLVGQDFLFACAAYPEEEPLATEVAAEAREQVVRLMPHPSLVLWVGNNENIWGWHDWDWQPALAGRSWGAGYYHRLLPDIVAELDPVRRYWPGSPYSGAADRHPNEPAHGTTHIWDVWNTHDYRHYRSYRPRFVAEFGFQAPPAYATLRRSVSDEPLAPDSPGLRHHQKAIEGNEKLARGLAGHLPEPSGFDDWHWATQLNQARAITFGIEHFRSLRPLCMGTILWQLNDLWPVTSWSVVDGDGRRKPLWYALRRAYADRLLTIQPAAPPAPDGAAGGAGGPGLDLVALNDGTGDWRAEVEVARMDFAGRVLAGAAVTIEVPAGGSARVPLPAAVATCDAPGGELLAATGAGGRALWFFAEDVDLDYPTPDFDARVLPAAGGYTVEITARVLLRDVTLFADRLDPAATVDEQLLTLLPGESASLRVSTGRELEAARLTVPPVLRCANDLCGVPRAR